VLMEMTLAFPVTPHVGIDTVPSIDLTPFVDQHSVYKSGEGNLGFPFIEDLYRRIQ
jgi:hypothetical protein